MKLKDYQTNGVPGVVKATILQEHITIVLLHVDFKELPKSIDVPMPKNLLGVAPDDNILWIADYPYNGFVGGAYDVIRKHTGRNDVFEAWCDSLYCLIRYKDGMLIEYKMTK